MLELQQFRLPVTQKTKQTLRAAPRVAFREPATQRTTATLKTTQRVEKRLSV